MSRAATLFVLPAQLCRGGMLAGATLQLEAAEEAMNDRGWPSHTCFVQLVLITAWTQDT